MLACLAPYFKRDFGVFGVFGVFAARRGQRGTSRAAATLYLRARIALASTPRYSPPPFCAGPPD